MNKAAAQPKVRKHGFVYEMKQNGFLYLLTVPGLLFFIIFCYCFK